MFRLSLLVNIESPAVKHGPLSRWSSCQCRVPRHRSFSLHHVLSCATKPNGSRWKAAPACPWNWDRFATRGKSGRVRSTWRRRATEQAQNSLLHHLDAGVCIRARRVYQGLHWCGRCRGAHPYIYFCMHYYLTLAGVVWPRGGVKASSGRRIERRSRWKLTRPPRGIRCEADVGCSHGSASPITYGNSCLLRPR